MEWLFRLLRGWLSRSLLFKYLLRPLVAYRKRVADDKLRVILLLESDEVTTVQSPPGFDLRCMNYRLPLCDNIDSC